MFGIRFTPPDPYWLEDLAYAALDGARRLPARIRALADRLREEAWHGYQWLLAQGPAMTIRKTSSLHAVAPAPFIPQPLDDAETWMLATEPLEAAESGAGRVVALQRTAAEQLDGITYVLERLRREIEPLMTYAPLASDTVQPMPTKAELDASIEALLELSRQNAVRRPARNVA